MDGIDVALVEIPKDQPNNRLDLVDAHTYPYPQKLVEKLHQAKALAETNPEALINSEIHRSLDKDLGIAFADAAKALIAQAKRTAQEITAIGSHGQTLCHLPEHTPPISLQLADPNTIARRTGITTVGRFRQADLDAGGQGAPLAPLLHQRLFLDATKKRCILNLGGIANVTLLLPGKELVGFDTGPANVLLDLWYQRHHQGPYDADGAWAKMGVVCDALVAQALLDPYFSKPHPKSTGIEYFGAQWLDRVLQNHRSLPAKDIQASLSEITAIGIKDALAGFDGVDELFVCGGGARNLDLLDRLAKHMPDTKLSTTDGLGTSADHLEAMLFAWLAHERLAGRTLDTRSITGARHRVLLGEIYGRS